MYFLKVLIVVLVATGKAEFCDYLSSNSVDCRNETNKVVLMSNVRSLTNICYLCYGQDCLDPYEIQAAEVECESSCYIGIDEFGFPIRGCASEYANTKDCSKDENSISQCFTCDGDYCNAIIYPIKGRLQCHTCFDEFCQPSEDDVQYCTRYHNDEKCVTIYSPNVDAVETRGCLSDVDTLNECTENSNNCLTCSIDKCNSDDSISKKFSCIGCNSIDNHECLESNYPEIKRCSSNQCFTRLTQKSANENMLERGCTADIASCTGSDCISCSGTNCNNKIFPENRLSCKFCVGDSCSTRNLKDKLCHNYIANDACITFYGSDDKVIYKDCFDDIPIETQNICSNPDNLECTKCSGPLCNQDLNRRGNRCYQCSGIDCFRPTLADVIDCTNDCFVGVDTNGYSVRGCANKVPSTISHIQTCTGDYCNVIVHPVVGRLQCHTCLDELCLPSDDDVKFCSSYNRNEKCVTIYSQDDKVKTRGCISDVDHENVCSENSNNCLTCSTDKCNSDDSKSKIFSCIGCNSVDDAECLGNELKVMTKRCATDQCYTRLTSDSSKSQILERGCLTDIESCTSSDCLSCTGPNCNNKIYPENRISCKFCIGDSCSNGHPFKDKICHNYIANDACMTFYGTDNRIIYKDCIDDVPNETRDVCSNPQNLQCTKCSGPLCNTDVKRRGTKCYQCSGIDCFYPVIGDVFDCLSGCFVGHDKEGKTVRGCAENINNLCSNCPTCSDDFCNGITYPVANRLSCLTCLGGSDCTNIDTSKYCEILSPLETCLTVFDSADRVIERGCLSTVSSAQTCKNNPLSCSQCQFDNCNVQTSILQKNNCISCNSKFDVNCVTNPKAVMTIGCKGKCYSRMLSSDNQHIERGCRDTDVSACTTGSCLECDGERCNSNPFPANRLSCYKCAGNGCDVGDLEMKKELCVNYDANEMICLTVFGENATVILKGCYSDVTKETQTMCDDINDISCTKCTGYNCNNGRKRRGTKCIQCTGLDCLSSNYLANILSCQSGGCYVGVDANGVTQKGCASSFQNTTSCAINDDAIKSKLCLVCDKDFCNAIVYPLENRLTCMDCYGEECDDVSINEKYCERLHTNERCISVFDDENKILERGCSSTVQNSIICGQNSSNCLQCNANLCNTQKSRDELCNCVSCSSKTDATCASNNSNPTIKSCLTNQCYSRLLPVSSTSPWQYIEKGCISDLPSSNPICSNCTTCSGSLCNNIQYPSNLITCRHCIGDDCKSSSVSKSCGLYNQQKQGCITIFTEKSSVIYRGCYSDAPMTTQEICDDTTQLACTKCNSPNNCNTDEVRRGFKCYKCSGLECFTPSHPADVIDCTSNCYVGLNNNGESVRGCSSSFSNQTCGMDEDNQHNCIACQDDYCNGIIYPAIKRISCHNCRDCQTTSDDNINYCPNYGHAERCVTVFDQDNKVMERGCASLLNNKLYCSLNNKYCIECATFGCNNITSVDSKMCAHCDSLTNPNCVLNPKAVATKSCEGGCYTRLLDEHLYRGCLEDLNGLQCNSDNDCVSCSDTDKCNVIGYPNNRMDCLTCNNSTDCIQPKSRTCIKYRDRDTCVTIFNGYNVAKKGCYADQASNDQGLCSENNNDTCLTCSFNNCNTLNVRPDEKCIVCKSDINPECAQKPQLLTPETCLLPSDGQCFAKISGKTTLRGCKGSLSPLEMNSCRNNSVSSECIVSSGQGSNNKLIPLVRLKCFYCDSQRDVNCTKKQTSFDSILPCRSYARPENCMKITYSDGRVVRGCSADISNDLCSNERCEFCPSNSITDGCNFSFAGKLNESILVLSLMSFVGLLVNFMLITD